MANPVRPNIPPGAIALIYSASPVCALVDIGAGVAIHVDERERIWHRHGRNTGITRSEYDEYFEGSLDAVAIALGAVRRLPQPLALPQLRQGHAWFRPPQSFRYLTRQPIASLGVL